MMEELIEEFGIERVQTIKTGEIFPSYSMPAFIQTTERRKSSTSVQDAHLTVLRWGIPKGFAPGDHINARSETILDKKTFREPFLERRCILPASGFFEWKRDSKPKEKYYFTLPGQMMWMCGVYTLVGNIPSYALLTTSANASMEDIHHRMPVMIAEENLVHYLDDTDFAVDFLTRPQPMLERTLV